MNPQKLLALASEKVPSGLRPSGRIVDRTHIALAGPGEPDDEAIDQAIAKTLGVELPAIPAATDSGDVVFSEETPYGVRSTLVQVRDGKVAAVVRVG